MVRCVRRAFLCGDDPFTGKNFDHRKQWITSRLRFLSYIYAIDIAAYAVMSNHYHVVLHVDAERAKGWSKEEVVERWTQLFNGHLLVERWMKGEKLDAGQLEKVDEFIEKWRNRLTDISWFMRCVNEKIAFMANKEEGCKGRFWEGRFKSQALLDEAAVLTCMAYVDLNPVRAGLAETPELSDFTSLQQRIYDYGKQTQQKSEAQQQVQKRVEYQEEVKKTIKVDHWPQAPLMQFDGSAHTPISCALPFTEQDYLELVDSTGRAIREDKKGFIPSEVPPILQRLGIEPSIWIEQIKCYGRSFNFCTGRLERMRSYAERFEQCWFQGIGASRRLYKEALA